MFKQTKTSIPKSKKKISNFIKFGLKKKLNFEKLRVHNKFEISPNDILCLESNDKFQCL
jgi:hypothetical protein